MTKKQRLSREVIEHRLLTSLENDKDVVAALLNKSDIELLLQALDSLMGKIKSPKPKDIETAIEFREDLEQLRDQAFGDS